MILVLSCALAALLGFAAQRASICNVRAVAEMIGSGTAHMLASIGKSVLWAAVVLFLWLPPSAALALYGYQFSALSLFGGFLFGVGAGINGACAFSTLARLADGQLGMLGTLGGFLLGLVGFEIIAGSSSLFRPNPATPLVGAVLASAGMMSALALVLWALYEAVRLWRSRPSGQRFKDLALAAQYRLSTAAVLIGLANGVLYLIHGAWGYTGTLQQGVEGVVHSRNWPTATLWVLFLAMFAGMVLSTWQRRSLRVDWPARRAWARHLGGGALMGAGAALAPGGNDALILFGIPSLSPHAVPAYLAMMGGMAVALVVMRRGLGVETRVECVGDVCRVTAAPAQLKSAPAKPI